MLITSKVCAFAPRTQTNEIAKQRSAFRIRLPPERFYSRQRYEHLPTLEGAVMALGVHTHIDVSRSRLLCSSSVYTLRLLITSTLYSLALHFHGLDWSLRPSLP